MVGDASGKESTCQCKRYKRHRFDPWIGKIPWSRKWQPTPVFLLGQFHGQRSLVSYSPWGHKESDMTEQLTLFTLKTFHTCSPLLFPEQNEVPPFAKNKITGLA